jgi:hypothetical protein
MREMKTETTSPKEGKVEGSLWSDDLLTWRFNNPMQLSIQLHEAVHEVVMKMHEAAIVGIAS